MTWVDNAGSDSMRRPRSAADVRGSSSIQSRRIAAPGCTGSRVTSAIRSFVSAVVITRPLGPNGRTPLYRSEAPAPERDRARCREDAYAARFMSDSARLGRAVLPVRYDLLIETDGDISGFEGEVTIT